MKKVAILLVACSLVAFAPVSQADEMPPILSQLNGAQVMSDVEMVEVEGSGLFGDFSLGIDPLTTLLAALQYQTANPEGDTAMFLREYIRDAFIVSAAGGPGGGLLLQVLQDGGLTPDTQGRLRSLFITQLAGGDPQIAALISLLQINFGAPIMVM